MFYLALISGLINLSAQTVYQKIVSMTVGDLYTTFMAVLLTFIVGAAVGGYLGFYLRRFLPWIELFSGLYALFLFIPLSGPFYNYDISLPLVIAALFLPALSLGTHLPLYSIYLRQQRFGFIYSLYHWGAILGLIAFEWYFVHAGSVKYALAFLGVCQTILGIVLIVLARQNRFELPKARAVTNPLPVWLSKLRGSVISVLAASTLSFFHLFWALKTQVALTEGFRMQATMTSAAVLFWMSTAGVASKILPRLERAWIFFFIAVSVVLTQLTFPWIPMAITDLSTGSLAFYFLISLLLAIYLTLPVFFSSLVFIQETETAHQCLDIDQASGGLNLFASLGNILGFVFGALLASEFWKTGYFAASLLAALALFLSFIFESKTRKPGKVLIALLALSTVSVFAFSHHQQNYLFLNRLHKPTREIQTMTDVWIRSSALSSIALVTRQLTIPVSDLPQALQVSTKPARFYIVDGHLSHDIFGGSEYMSGISGAKFFSHPLKKSLVIGIGSGQAAWGLMAISEHTDMVEISPAVLENLSALKEFNEDLLTNPHKTIHLKDGFSFVRDCQPGSYDLILNTATYPSNFNAAKLYSTEFVGLAKKCMSPEGVFQTYFDFNSVINMQQLNEFLAPLRAHFKYVDIMIEPYPQVYAYDQARQIEKIKDADFPRAEDLAVIQRLRSEQKLFHNDCQDFLRNPPPPPSPVEISSLDRATLEANSFLNSVGAASGNFEFLNVDEFFQPPPGQVGAFTCE